MPAVSKQQAKLMRLVRGVQTGDIPKSKVSDKAAKMADTMDPKDVKDFAKTPEKGLPKKVKSEGIAKQIMKESVMSTLHLLAGESRDFNHFLQLVKRALPSVKMDKSTVEGLKRAFEDFRRMKEVAPKGWEGTVKAMKGDKGIDNPWALAHWMKGKGYKSHKKESLKEECWKGYVAYGTKMKDGREVPNCVPKESVEEDCGCGQAPTNEQPTHSSNRLYLKTSYNNR